jgi:hypothetical protein
MANKPAGAAKKKGGADPATPGRIKQIRMVAGIIRKANPRALPIVALAGVGVLAVFVIVGLFTGLLPILIPLGLASGLMAAMLLFGRFAQSAQYAAVEGQPGAAAAILQSMRGGWTVTPAVSANRSLDVVHRASCWWVRGPPTGWGACSPPRRSGSPGSPTTCPSTTSRWAARKARSRSGGFSAS